ncbi:MAG: hypothetical protein ABSF29_00160 [Tepidisphaeraceae bacterium]
MPSPKPPRTIKTAIRIAAVLVGLYGGWLLAGVLNDHRSDVPRPVPPSTRP